MKLSKKSKILILFLGILIILALHFYQKEIRNFFYFISAPLQKTLWAGGEGISDFFQTISEIKNLKKENEELKLKIKELKAENVALKELKKENQILRKALKIGLEKEFKLNFARVIAKDIFQDSLIIDRGIRDGILEGLPVITEQKTLVGRIGKVYQNFSKVILISNRDLSFSAKISDSEIYGVVRGKGNLELFLDLIPREKEIQEGDLVVTTALGGVFPKGLLVGKIEQVKKSDVEPFQQAKISPFFNIQEIEVVFIITNFPKYF